MKHTAVGYDCDAIGSWGVADSPVTGRPCLHSGRSGDMLRIALISDESSVLVFLKHDWSGVCEITDGGVTTTHDLYANTEHGEILEIPVAASPSVVDIRVAVEFNLQSKSTQVWFLGVRIGKELHAVDRGGALSDSVRMIAGKWGNFLALRTDTGVAEGLARHGEWAPHDIALFQTILREGMVVLDIGANFGHHSVVFSKLVGERGLVIAFEPQQVMYNLLCGNIVLNGLYNVRTMQSALADKRGTVEMYPISYEDHVNFGSLGVNVSSPSDELFGCGEHVAVLKLDSVINDFLEHHSKIDFIKIDVQSFELFVLKGATLTLTHHHPTLFLEIAPVWMQKAGYSYIEIYDFLLELGYTITHPSLPNLKPNKVRDWDGESDIEWDILATHHLYQRA
jgi:FkbM family methyltransferase